MVRRFPRGYLAFIGFKWHRTRLTICLIDRIPLCRHFPKARVWPPVARMSAGDITRQDEIEALQRAALARMPSREVQEQLLDLYFAHVHIFLPIVDKESFMTAFRAM